MFKAKETNIAGARRRAKAMTAAFAFTSRDDDRYETKSAASATVHAVNFGKILSEKY